MKKGKFSFSDLFLALAMIAVIGAMVMPIRGGWALGGQACAAAAFLFFGVYLLSKFLAGRGALPSAVIILLFVFGVFGMGASVPITIDVVQDARWGTNEELLTNCDVQYVGISDGVINLQCYVVGLDENGNEVRVQISCQDAREFEREETILVEYYPNTMRAAKLSRLIIVHKHTAKKSLIGEGTA